MFSKSASDSIRFLIENFHGKIIWVKFKNYAGRVVQIEEDWSNSLGFLLHLQ